MNNNEMISSMLVLILAVIVAGVLIKGLTTLLCSLGLGYAFAALAAKLIVALVGLIAINKFSDSETVRRFTKVWTRATQTSRAFRGV